MCHLKKHGGIKQNAPPTLILCRISRGAHVVSSCESGPTIRHQHRIKQMAHITDAIPQSRDHGSDVSHSFASERAQQSSRNVLDQIRGDRSVSSERPSGSDSSSGPLALESNNMYKGDFDDLQTAKGDASSSRANQLSMGQTADLYNNEAKSVMHASQDQGPLLTEDAIPAGSENGTHRSRHSAHHSHGSHGSLEKCGRRGAKSESGDSGGGSASSVPDSDGSASASKDYGSQGETGSTESGGVGQSDDAESGTAHESAPGAESSGPSEAASSMESPATSATSSGAVSGLSSLISFDGSVSAETKQELLNALQQLPPDIQQMLIQEQVKISADQISGLSNGLFDPNSNSIQIHVGSDHLTGELIAHEVAHAIDVNQLHITTPDGGMSVTPSMQTAFNQDIANGGAEATTHTAIEMGSNPIDPQTGIGIGDVYAEIAAGLLGQDQTGDGRLLSGAFPNTTALIAQELGLPNAVA